MSSHKKPRTPIVLAENGEGSTKQGERITLSIRVDRAEWPDNSVYLDFGETELNCDDGPFFHAGNEALLVMSIEATKVHRDKADRIYQIPRSSFIRLAECLISYSDQLASED